MLVMTAYDLRRTYFEGGHRERVNIALFGGVAIRETKLRWVEQFRSHIADNAWFRRCRITWLHDGGIGFDSGDPEVP